MARLKFDVLDLFRASQGIKREDGYAVIPQDIADKMEEEYERLYEIEEIVLQAVDRDGNGISRPQLTMSQIYRLSDLLGIDLPIGAQIPAQPS